MNGFVCVQRHPVTTHHSRDLFVFSRAGDEDLSRAHDNLVVALANIVTLLDNEREENNAYNSLLRLQLIIRASFATALIHQ
ncbi:hypothetical protein N7451_011031 [Penicillium sp. IBT 35674x]|nr:hypothetical protein N7451_011031 [Penicillium sp. IBT 35674x]